MTAPQPAPAQPFSEPSDAPRKDLVAGAVNAAEKEQVLRALDDAGFRNQSDGVRSICFAFVESADVREAVLRHLRERKAS